jgi:hypothetical protein
MGFRLTGRCRCTCQYHVWVPGGVQLGCERTRHREHDSNFVDWGISPAAWGVALRSFRSDETRLPAMKLISRGAYLVGVLCGTSIQLVMELAEVFASGDPNADVLLLLAALVAYPFLLLINCAMGFLPFILLRNAAPGKGLSRFVFVAAILAPIVTLVGLVGELWIDGLTPYSPYFPSPKPPLAVRLPAVIGDEWPIILAVTFGGAIACWGFDKRQLPLTGPG